MLFSLPTIQNYLLHWSLCKMSPLVIIFLAISTTCTSKAYVRQPQTIDGSSRTVKLPSSKYNTPFHRYNQFHAAARLIKLQFASPHPVYHCFQTTLWRTWCSYRLYRSFKIIKPQMFRIWSIPLSNLLYFISWTLDFCQYEDCIVQVSLVLDDTMKGSSKTNEISLPACQTI